MIVKSIKAKLTLWYVGTLIVIVVFFSVAIYFSLKNTLNRSIDISLDNFKEELKDALLSSPVKEWKNVINKEGEEEVPIPLMYIQILHINGKGGSPVILAKSRILRNKTLPYSKKALISARMGKTYIETAKWFSMYPLRVILSPVNERGNVSYVMEIATPLRGVLNILRKFLFILLISGTILVIILSLWSYFFVNRAFMPVKNIVATVKRITSKDLSLRIRSVETKDEIGELANTFNEMISRLESSFKQIKQFSSDVSHELKTPLTVIKGEVEVSLRRDRRKKEYKNTLKILLEETTKLEKIIENLLFLSHMDGQSKSLSFKRISLDEILLEVFEDTEKMARQKEIHLILKGIKPVYTKGEENLLKRLLTNLIDNAIKYTPTGGSVEISLESDRKFARFIIKDTGVGIPEDKLEHIFDRFYRVDEARSTSTGGSGLGLSIVKQIVEVHKGEIEVKSELNRGSTFIIYLPV